MEEKKNSVWVDVICIDSTIPIFENIFNYLFVASALTDTTHVEPSTLRCDVIKLLTKNTSVSIVLKWGYFWNDATIPYETLFVLRINFANCKRSVFAQQLAIARSMILLRTFYLDPPIDRLVHCKCMLRTDYDRIKFVFHWKKKQQNQWTTTILFTFSLNKKCNKRKMATFAEGQQVKMWHLNLLEINVTSASRFYYWKCVRNKCIIQLSWISNIHCSLMTCK